MLHMCIVKIFYIFIVVFNNAMIRFLKIFLFSLISTFGFAQIPCNTLYEKSTVCSENKIKSLGLKSEKMTTHDFKAKINNFDPNGRDIYVKSYYKSGKIAENISFYTNTNKSLIYSYNDLGLILEIENQSPKGVFFEKTKYVYNDNNSLEYALVYNEQKVIDIKYRYQVDANTCSIKGYDSLETKIKKSELWLTDSINLTEEHQYFDAKGALSKKDVFVFNSKYLLVKKSYINMSFGQQIDTEYMYDDSDRLIEEKTFDKEGKLRKKKSYKYETAILPTESITIDSENNPLSKDVYQYEFY
jgi:hypothetical protein